MTHTLYRFYDSNDQLLYVGITNNPARRFSKHRDEKSWWLTVARIALEQHPTREVLLQAEAAAIAAECPAHNIRMNGKPALTAIEPKRTSGLEGKWFHSWIPLPDDAPDDLYHRRGNKGVEWQGQILERIDTAYLVQLYSWWDGTADGGEQIVERAAMGNWTFYPTAQAMQMSLGCSEASGGYQCRNPATHRTVLGNYVCWRCADYYSSATEVAA